MDTTIRLNAQADAGGRPPGICSLRHRRPYRRGLLRPHCSRFGPVSPPDTAAVPSTQWDAMHRERYANRRGVVFGAGPRRRRSKSATTHPFRDPCARRWPSPRLRGWGDRVRWVTTGERAGIGSRSPAVCSRSGSTTEQADAHVCRGGQSPSRPTAAFTTCRGVCLPSRLSTAFDSVTLYGAQP